MKRPALSIVEPASRHQTGGTDDLRFTVVSSDKRHLDQIMQATQRASGTAAVSAIDGTIRQLGAFENQPVPDVLIVDSVCADRSDLDSLERLGRIYPHMDFIVLCGQQSPDFLIQAMRAGVREVLPSPVNGDALETAIERIRRKKGFARARQGKILAFISCKGGSGATFLAANLAYIMAAHGNRKVALFDFNLQFGDALMFLSDQTPATTLSDVARGIHRLDAAFLASSMVSADPNLSVLSAPENPAHGMEVKPEHIDAVLTLARNHYDLIVLDVGRSLDAQMIEALDHADMIFAVLQTTLPFIRDGKRLLDVFRTLDYPESKVGLIVNRYEKGGDIGIGELEQSLGAKVLRTIPNHYEAVAASVNQGIPVARLARNSPVSKALFEWSESHAGPVAREPGRWFKRVFRRDPIPVAAKME